MSEELHDQHDLRKLLEELLTEHRLLDAEVFEVSSHAIYDQLHVLRLKRKKLVLKDHIRIIESKLVPNIIA